MPTVNFENVGAFNLNTQSVGVLSESSAPNHDGRIYIKPNMDMSLNAFTNSTADDIAVNFTLAYLSAKTDFMNKINLELTNSKVVAMPQLQSGNVDNPEYTLKFVPYIEDFMREYKQKNEYTGLTVDDIIYLTIPITFTLPTGTDATANFYLSLKYTIIA